MNNSTSNTALKLIPTNEKVTVENYPYGFKLRTTLFDYIEFDKKKGYRHCTQTINPKNGVLNAPKKSTYYKLMVRFYDEIGHIKTRVCDFNGDEAINKGCKFVAENFDIFTPDEIKYIYDLCYIGAIIDLKATVIYGGSKADDLAPLYKPFFDLCKQGLKDGVNLFNIMQLDCTAIEATKPVGFSPFVSVNHYEIDKPKETTEEQNATPEALKTEISELIKSELPNFYSEVVYRTGTFGGNYIKIVIACSNYEINRVQGQYVQDVSLCLDYPSMELRTQIFGCNGGQSIYREPNKFDSKESFLAMKSVKIPFRKPQNNKDAVLNCISKFCRNYKEVLKANVETLCYQDKVNYNQLLGIEATA